MKRAGGVSKAGAALNKNVAEATVLPTSGTFRKKTFYK